MSNLDELTFEDVQHALDMCAESERCDHPVYNPFWALESSDTPFGYDVAWHIAHAFSTSQTEDQLWACLRLLNRLLDIDVISYVNGCYFRRWSPDGFDFDDEDVYQIGLLAEAYLEAVKP